MREGGKFCVKRFRLERLESRLMMAGDPVAEWNFDSSSGTTLVDAMGTANGIITGSSVYNATATAMVDVMPVWTASNSPQWGTGTQGGALRLFSDTDGAIVESTAMPDFATVSLWFKADNTNPTRYNPSTGDAGSTSNTSVAMPLFESGSSSAGVNIYIYNNRLYVGAWNSAISGWSNGTFLYTTQNAIHAGRWHHVVLSLPTSTRLQSGGLNGYLDGVQFGSGSGASINIDSSTAFGRVDSTTRFLLGTSGTSTISNNSANSSNHRGFAGYIDEARVYDESLTGADVLEIRDETAPAMPEEEWLVRDSGMAATIGRFRFAGQLASQHFVFKWGPDLPAAMQPVTTYIQQNLNRLEMSWDILVDQSGMAPPSPRNGINYKINAYILETGLWLVDANGGTFAGAFAGPDPRGYAALYTSSWALAQYQNPRSITVSPWVTVANTTTTPHEFTHVLQSESGGFANSSYSGPFWEAHANFGASLVDAYDTGNYRAQITARSSILGRYGERRHRYSLATDFRYQAHLFLNYLTERPEYGASFVTGGLWSDVDAQGNNKDPWEVLRNNFSSDAEFAEVYSEFVASSVTYKSLYDGALLSGLPAIPAHDTTDRLYRTYLEPVGSSPGWYQVPEQDTPEQYGSNIVPLTLLGKSSGQPHLVTVDLDGYKNPGESSGIFAKLVAVSGSGATTQEWFSPTWQQGELTWEVPAAASHLYLTVTAIPSVHKNYIWSHPFHGTGVGHKIERFAYRVSMEGAVPTRNEPPTDRPAPSRSAMRHTNPDGSVGGYKTVFVPATVYVGYNAQVTGGTVTGNARIENYATVTGGIVSESAIVRGHATVQGGQVRGNSVIDDYAVIAGGTIYQNARVKGDSRIESGQVRGSALLLDYATVFNNATIIEGDTVIKGYGVVDNAEMSGNAIVMSSGLASGTGLVTDMGVQYNGEPAQQEVPLMATQFQNLFARYTFDSLDDNIIWDDFNTTYGWMSESPATWQYTSGVNGLNGVLQFSSDDQYVDLSPELSDLRNETFQFWTRWDGSGSSEQKMLEFRRDSDNYMYLQPTSGAGAKFEIAVAGEIRTLYGGQSLTPGQWQHVAITFDDETVTLYVDGAAVASKTTVDMDPHEIRATSALLGRGLASGTGYRGDIDELLVYSDARTSGEILADVRQILGNGYTPASPATPDYDPGDYNRDRVVNLADYTLWRNSLGSTVTTLGVGADGNRDGLVDSQDYLVWKSLFRLVTPEPDDADSGGSLVAQYVFDGTALDSTGNNDGVTTGGPTYADGISGQAIDLDGSDDYVSLPAGVANFDDITIATWVNWEGGGFWQRIFDFGNNTTDYMFLSPRSGADTLRFAITVGGNGQEQILDTGQLATGQWVHVAVTLEGDTGTMYVNGVPVDVETISIDPSQFSPTQNYIGNSQWPDPLLNGRIDDFRIYNYALSPTEIGVIMETSLLAGMSSPESATPLSMATLVAAEGSSEAEQEMVPANSVSPMGLQSRASEEDRSPVVALMDFSSQALAEALTLLGSPGYEESFSPSLSQPARYVEVEENDTDDARFAELSSHALEIWLAS